jgi:hypothetical protein
MIGMIFIFNICPFPSDNCVVHVTSDEIKDFYNERFDEICDIVCPEELLKEPTKVKGYYLDSVDKKIKTNLFLVVFRCLHQDLSNDCPLYFH